jgi:hypothetical protein
MKRALAFVLLLALVACGGPEVPLQIVGKSVPVDVAFGPNGALPDVGVRPVPGGFVIVPTPIPPDPLDPFEVPPPPAPLKPCPKADPLAFPKEVATDTVTEPPAAARYPFRVSGERTHGEQTESLPSIAFRTVGNIGRTITDDLRYDVAEATETEAEATIWSYQVTSRAIELTGVQHIVNGETSRFAPLTPIQILPLPPRQVDALGRGVTTWTSTGSDPVSQTTWVVDGQLIGDGKARVDACGEIIDTWLAELSVQTISPTEDTTATWRINVATQYGGLIVRETIATEGTKDGRPYSEQRRTVISEVPR